ncbi:MAG TPA: DUF4265 domain-containing protein [Gemmatimonadales bacterium]|nr:DUF4265 domain-containing protein [Gemmatimonadales bacterium]
MVDDDLIAVHERPVWKERANFLVHIDLHPWGLPGRLEQLWVRREGERLFELCCIPFFSYGFHLGDVVETTPQNDLEFVVNRVVSPSGRRNIRIAVINPDDAELITKRLEVECENLCCPYEVCRPGYMAIDLPSPNHERVLLTAINDLLQSRAIMMEEV